MLATYDQQTILEAIDAESHPNLKTEWSVSKQEITVTLDVEMMHLANPYPQIAKPVSRRNLNAMIVASEKDPEGVRRHATLEAEMSRSWQP